MVLVQSLLLIRKDEPMYRRLSSAAYVILILFISPVLTAHADTPNYDREAAAYYARFWSQNGGNPAYRRYANDCTNFISQALRYGGWPDVPSYWYTLAERQDKTVWWHSDFLNRNSWTWDNAEYFASFLGNSGRARRVTGWGDLQVGDVVQMVWKGEERVGHTAMVTLIDRNGMVHLSQHDEDRLDKPITEYPPDAVYLKWHLSTGSLSNGARFLSDVTIPDGTLLSPNQPFSKAWQLKNTGSLT